MSVACCALKLQELGYNLNHKRLKHPVHLLSFFAKKPSLDSKVPIAVPLIYSDNNIYLLCKHLSVL